MGVSQLIYFADTHSFDKINCLYAFPTYRQLNDFYKQRIKSEFENGGYYASLVDPRQMSMNQMKVRDSTIMFRTSSKGASMEGVKIDLLSLDEYDRIDQVAEQSALESMKSSNYQMTRRWSTPTASHYMIDALYEKSDQRMWFIKCNHCGYEQVMDYDKNIKLIHPDGIDEVGKVVLPGTYEYVCQKCGKLLDRWYGGHWETTAPGSGRIHGYRISQMDAVWVSASALKQVELNSPSKQYFYNYSLGKPYTDSSNKFMQSDVLDHLDLDEKPINRDNYSLVSTGIDWGQHFNHVVTLGLRKDSRAIDLIGLKRVRTVTDVENLNQDVNGVMQEIKKYNPDVILPDSGYSGPNNLILKKEFGDSRVYEVKVRSAQSNGDINAHFNESDNTVTIDKLMQNMIMMSNMRRGDIHFWRPLDQDEKLFIQHWDNVVIRTDEESDPKTHELKLVKRILRKNGDHYAQSSVYAMVGMNYLLNQEAEVSHNKVLTTTISDSFETGEQTDLVQELNIM